MTSVRRRSKRSNKRTRVIRRTRLSVRRKGGGFGLTHEEVCTKQKKAVSDYLNNTTMDDDTKNAVLTHLKEKKNCSDIGILGAEDYVKHFLNQIPSASL
jgi:hypothetical protein